MNSEQANLVGSGPQARTLSGNRLSSKFHQNQIVQPGSLDDSFLNLFQDLFQSPKPQELEPNRSEPKEDTQPKAEAPQKPKREDSEEDREERIQPIQERLNKFDDLEKLFKTEAPVKDEHLAEDFVAQPIFQQDTPIKPEVEVVKNVFPQETAPEKVTQVVPEQEQVAVIEDLVRDPEVKKDTNRETLQEFLTRNRSTSQKDQEVVKQPVQLEVTKEARPESKNEQLPVEPVQKETPVKVESEKRADHSEVKTEQSVKEPSEKKDVKEGTIFDRSGRGKNSAESRDQNSVEGSSIQRLKQQQAFAEKKTSDEFVQAKFQTQKQNQSDAQSANDLLSRNLAERQTQTVASGNVLKAGQFQISGKATTTSDTLAVDAIKAGAGKSTQSESGTQGSLVGTNGVEATKNGIKKTQNAAKPNVPQRIPASDLINRLSGVIKQSPKGTSQLTLHVTPVELGAIELSITVSEGIVSAKAVAENVDTQRLLMEGLDSLKSRLSEQGLTVDRFDIELGSQSEFSQSQSNDAWLNGGQTSGNSTGSGNGERLPGQNSQHSSDQRNEVEETKTSENNTGKWAVDVVV